MTRRCPLHGDELLPGVRARAPASALSGRKHAFGLAEQTLFPAAGALLFCREGDLRAEFCPACRAALLEWLAHPAREPLREALAPALAKLLQNAQAAQAGSPAAGVDRSLRMG